MIGFMETAPRNCCLVRPGKSRNRFSALNSWVCRVAALCASISEYNSNVRLRRSPYKAAQGALARAKRLVEAGRDVMFCSMVAFCFCAALPVLLGLP